MLGVLHSDFSNQPVALDEIKARIFGETAAVTSRIKMKSAPSSGRMTNVYVKQQGRWQCVASHTSGVIMGTCPGVDTATGSGQFFEQTPAGQPSIPATRLGELGNKCMACHVASHQAPSNAGKSDANVLYPPNAPQRSRTGQEIRIRPRFKCLVERVYVKAGQTVKKGDPLVDCSAPSIWLKRRMTT